MRSFQEEINALRAKVQVLESVEHCDMASASTELEKSLMHRLQRTEGDCAQYRVHAADADAQIRELRSANERLEEQAEDNRRLLAAMEAENQQQPWQSASAPIAILGPTAGEPPPDGGGESGDALPSLTEIALTQRERLRQRCLEVEQSRDEWKGIAGAQRARTARLESDCVALVEKVRFLESRTPVARQREVDRDFESLVQRHGGEYEQRLAREVTDFKPSGGGGVTNPFSAFREGERQRKLRLLGPAERSLILVLQSVVKSRGTRLLFIAYLALLHLSVAGCVMRMSVIAVRDV
eukprot:Polyplicarium_translucidae@DN3030_c0_g2_i1.p1